MINKDKGGGGQFLDFMGGHSFYEWGNRAHVAPPLGKTLLVPGIVSTWAIFIHYLQILFFQHCDVLNSTPIN